MFILALIPILMGSGLAMQTAVNSKLRSYVVSPYLASAISFTIGTIFLIVLTLISGINPFISTHTLATNPWWIWSGGLLGVIGLTVNLLLFPKLGSVQTSVLPIFGQIIMGVIIDQFGLFYSPKSSLTLFKILGLLLVTGGMLITTGVFSKHKKINSQKSSNLIWQLVGIGAGMLIATQAAINGHLGVVLDSSVHAAMISFTIGTILLISVVLIFRLPVSNLKLAINTGAKNWWIWLGGFLGAFYVFGSAWLVPQIGTGQVVVIALFGQLFFSALIDQFGFFQSKINRVEMIRIIGLVAMFLGVVSVHFL
ncbi:hypothetical protein FD29_GL001220 [Companilactobacillus mindensis DSM 14500]|uniref:Integral membrane protein n=1 Tax=Companilactobacillus mindensis DSM 14500 TaxID=1423770 RepID=A0A0R1QM97_9LACO|nr:DMT family transporter [Companilactobacillus mindensis]KRL43106.1 hypothetical protein FD29_GL001220 [Companilactobacillus mindensis DSM 14500]GEO78946.1 membrane protein [Companilactobacillus mindensis]